MHSPGVSRRGIEKSCLRTIPRPSSPATGLAHRAAIQTPSFPDAQLRIVDGASAPDRVCGALFENRIVEMDCVPTRNALILDGMTQIVRD